MAAHSTEAQARLWRRTCLLGAVALAVLTGLPACSEHERAPRLNPYAACESALVRDVTVQEAAASVQAEHGSVALVMFYASGCSLSQAFFPEFLRISGAFGEQGVKVFAFSTDDCKQDLEDFLASYQPTFDPTVLVPWQSGDLSAAFAGIGIQFGSPWMKPLVAVVGKDGVAAMQWQPATEYDVDEIETVIEEELAR